MSRVIDHSKKYKILEEAKKVYPMPDLDKILPPNIEALEDKMTEEEFDKFVTKKFNSFYSRYVNSSVKELFVNLPLEFFTKENVERVRWYANIAFAIKVENCEETHETISSKKFYEDVHEKFLKRLIEKREELKKKNLESMQNFSNN